MTSPSTLIRKAANAKNPAAAKRLRTEAARLRRLARKKAYAPKKAKNATIVVESMTAHELAALVVKQADTEQGINREPMASTWRAVTEEPIIDGDAIEMLRAHAKEKHKPDGTDRFAIALRGKMLDARIRGQKETEDFHVAQLKNLREINAINVVCAFVAEIEGIGRLNNGPLPPSLMVSGFTIARVTDALRDAGYSADGKGGQRRNGPSETLRNAVRRAT